MTRNARLYYNPNFQAKASILVLGIHLTNLAPECIHHSHSTQ